MAEYGENRFPKTGDPDYEWSHNNPLDMQWLAEIFATAQDELGLGREVSVELMLDSVRSSIEFHAKLGKNGPVPVKAETIALAAFGVRVPELESEFDMVSSYLEKLVEEGMLIKNGGGYSLPTPKVQPTEQPKLNPLGLSPDQLEGVLRKMSKRNRNKRGSRADNEYLSWENDRRRLDEQAERPQRHPFS